MNSFTISRWLPALLPAAFVLACLTVLMPPLLQNMDLNYVHLFRTSFIGILLEALPFILIGSLLSSIVHLFVSEDTLRRWIPKNPVLGILFACTLGLIFPVCECGMIPLIRKLIQKGMPVYIAAVFILAGPIVNPVVYGATYMAFRLHPEMAYARIGLAFLVSAAIGWMIYATWSSNPLKREARLSHNHVHHGHVHTHHDHTHHDDVHHHHTHHDHALRDYTRHNHTHHNYTHHNDILHDHTHPNHAHGHSHHSGQRPHGLGGKITAVFVHSADEVFDMGKYLIMGCLITACIQSFIPRESMLAIGKGPVSSYLFMMGFAFLLSLCSTSDAFVAATFAHTFSTGSILAFLVFGPMMDLKNLLMLLSVFRLKFVMYFVFLICSVVFIGAILTDKLLLN